MRTVVIPAYNEEERIEAAVKALLTLEDVEIIISDDGSTDKTVEFAKRLLKNHKIATILSGEHKGKGAALRRGFNEGKGNMLGFLDADLSAKPEELEKLFFEIDSKNAELAIGSRELPGSVIPKRQPIHRRALGNAYSLLARSLFKVDVKDFQCGAKVFTRDLWTALNTKEDGFVFDTELIARSKLMGFRIKEVPITWINDRRSKVNPFKDSLGMFIGLLRIKWNLLREK